MLALLVQLVTIITYGMGKVKADVDVNVYKMVVRGVPWGHDNARERTASIRKKWRRREKNLTANGFGTRSMPRSCLFF